MIAPKKYRKFIVIGKIISSGKIDSFMCIKWIIKLIHFPNIGIESINYCFLDRKSSKMINNHFITVFNRMGRLKHQIKIFFSRSTKKISEICLQSKINYGYRIGGGNRCITLNRRRLQHREQSRRRASTKYKKTYFEGIRRFVTITKIDASY